MDDDIRQQAFNRTVAAFIKELQELQEKHGVVAAPIVDVSPHGIIPKIVYVDMESYNKRVEAMKQSIQVEK